MTEPTGGGGQPQSYAEKYRGTPYGRPEIPPPPPKGSRTPLVVALVAVSAIIAAGAGIVFLATSPGTSSLIPGPAGQATSTPGGTTAPRPTATPTPSADPGAAVLAGFWARVSAPDLSYRLTITGKTTLDRKTFESFTESYAVVGDEYSGTIRSHNRGVLLLGIQPSRIASASVARKGGIVYLKEAGKHRTARRSNDRSDRLTPFMYLQLPGWIDYVGPVSVKGRHLHLLRTNSFYRPDIARLLDLSKFEGIPDSMTLDVLVTTDGIPVSATFTEHLVGNDQFGKSHVFNGRADFVFSKVGAELTIAVPRP